MTEPTFDHPAILLIDDESFSRDIVAHGLTAFGPHRLHFSQDPTLAVERATSMEATVVLVDMRMPSMDGFEVARRLRADKATEHVAVIVLSSDDNPDRKAEAFDAGASDYLVKWPDPRELVARVRYHSNSCVTRRQLAAAFASLRQSREDLAASQSALLQSQKMEAIGQLTGGVAHDFNNVLQIINGNLQLLKLGDGLKENGRLRVETALTGVKRGAQLASQLLAFARRQPLQTVVTHPEHLLREMEDMTRRMFGPHHRITTDIASDLGCVLVDPNQLHNVLLNLAINARDAMAEGGELTIRAVNVAPDEVMPAQPSSQHWVMIEVADTGKGMTPDVLARVFEPFFTTKPAGQGTGLGLSMAYGFAKQSCGEIALTSVPGHGTSVRIYLPRSDGTPSAPELTVADWTEGGPETLLVVEDEASVRKASCESLSMLGYRVLQAQNAAQAVEVIQSGEQIDLVFSDVVMPGPVSSLQLEDVMRATLPYALILYTSGYAEGILTQEGRLRDNVNLLQKPYDFSALSARIRHLLNKRKR
ncbi:response regulator [Massilia sp. 9I]|uniref:response regulator n=1 Tax=Massilia sp. 9I TaxID=2653152 RepID=UPI0012F38F7D|nr:response regulator [Massilia sp. 9I]VXC12925.1 Hybrid sensor histidine kinase/response regulator [Massilia sp. 9I]